jgi:hypothetical protein
MGATPLATAEGGSSWLQAMHVTLVAFSAQFEVLAALHGSYIRVGGQLNMPSEAQTKLASFQKDDIGSKCVSTPAKQGQGWRGFTIQLYCTMFPCT